MRTSDAGINFIKTKEGFRSNAYLDGGGVPTIGYGFTSGVKMGDTITPEQAEARLKAELIHFENGVERLVKVQLTQNQFDSLVSFCFNVGVGALAQSTLLKKLNAGNYLGAADEFLKWCKDNGKTVAGLLKRRESERKIFLGELA